MKIGIASLAAAICLGVAQVVAQKQSPRYNAYENLVMAGYQGWFAAEGDGSERGWYHYQRNGKFEPGSNTIDFWPDMREYAKTYKTAFKYPDGTDAYLYSPYDEESVDLHFKWMKEHGIDGVHMQRFLGEVKNPNGTGRRHFDKVLENALKAARKYGRAISVMYDLSGSRGDDLAYLEEDWNRLVDKFDLFNETTNPTYLRHRGKPLLSVWGVGFNDNRRYSIADADKLIDKLKNSEKPVSVLLGVPYYWRTLGRDTENKPELHALIKKVDIIMPWAVGRYNADTYAEVSKGLKEDIRWCSEQGVDYVPLVFPGFSWGNMRNDPSIYHAIPRLKGDFFWQQVAGAKQAGAKSLYVAMFDEVDEGTAIFKCAPENNVPLNGDLKFLGIEEGLETDYYLWLTGQSANWFHGKKGYSASKPVRKATRK